MGQWGAFCVTQEIQEIYLGDRAATAEVGLSTSSPADFISKLLKLQQHPCQHINLEEDTKAWKNSSKGKK